MNLFELSIKNFKVENQGFDLSKTSTGVYINNETRLIYEGFKLRDSLLTQEVQRLRSENARYKMEVSLALAMLEDYDYEMSVGEVEHETQLHDRIKALIDDFQIACQRAFKA